MITLEERKMRCSHRNEMVVILQRLLKEFPYTQTAVDAEVGSPFFEDSCNFVGLHHELDKLIQTFKCMNEYSNWIVDDLT